MSGIAGVFHLDGRPADAALVRRMTGAMPYRGPDGIGHVVDGPVALGQCMSCTTPESLDEVQPLWDETRTRCLTLDGRVDNRDELIRDLKARGAVLRDDTDAELVLKAYATWGEESPRRIIGDFAYAIWDRRERQLFCARDPLGIRPLYYFADGKKLLWASELHCLFQDATVPRVVNEGMVAEHLANGPWSTTETLWHGVLRLEHAHWMAVRPTGRRMARYWEPQGLEPIRYRTDREYAEHFLVVFAEAVWCRLRSLRPVGAELSGGVDSSSVVGVANRLCPGLRTYSLVYPGLPCDETEYINAVAQHCGVESTRVRPALDADLDRWTASTYQDLPRPPNDGSAQLNALVTSAGGRVLLTGEGGDEWWTGERAGPGAALRRAVRSMLPAPLVSSIQLRRRRRHVMRETEQTCLSTALAARVGMPDRVPPSRWLSGFFATKMGWMERGSAAVGIDLRHPFHDRRLIELQAAFPMSQLTRHGTYKHVVRSAMSGILPERVRQRPTKAEFSSQFLDYFDHRQWERSFDRRTIAATDWVDMDGARRMLERLHDHRGVGTAQSAYPDFQWPLWYVFALDCWLTETTARSEAHGQRYAGNGRQRLIGHEGAAAAAV